jgi:hypothetical protein
MDFNKSAAVSLSLVVADLIVMRRESRAREAHIATWLVPNERRRRNLRWRSDHFRDLVQVTGIPRAAEKLLQGLLAAVELENADHVGVPAVVTKIIRLVGGIGLHAWLYMLLPDASDVVPASGLRLVSNE